MYAIKANINSLSNSSTTNKTLAFSSSKKNTNECNFICMHEVENCLAKINENTSMKN